MRTSTDLRLEAGDRLKDARLKANMSLRVAAAAIGCSVSSLSCWERAIIKVPNKALDKICETYGIEKEWLLEDPTAGSITKDFDFSGRADDVEFLEGVDLKNVLEDSDWKDWLDIPPKYNLLFEHEMAVQFQRKYKLDYRRLISTMRYEWTRHWTNKLGRAPFAGGI